MSTGNRMLMASVSEVPARVRARRILPLLALSALSTLAVMDAAIPAARIPTPPPERAPTHASSITPGDIVAIGHDRTSGDVKAAILAGSRWLIGHQFPEGAWDGDSFVTLCGETPCPGRGKADHRVGLTALALNALIEARPLFAEQSDADLAESSVVRGLRWLRSVQDADGCFAVERAGRSVYGHIVAVEAMTRGFMLTGDLEYRRSAARGVRFLEIARAPDSGWGYHLQSSRCDTSVTGWAAKALLTARQANIAFDPAALDGALRWLRAATSADDDSVSYNGKGRGSSYMEGINDAYDANETLTAVNVFVRSGMSMRESAVVRSGLRRLSRDLPVWKENLAPVDYLYWYFGTLAMRRALDEGNDLRREWMDRATTILMSHQWRGAAGCRNGSWDSVDKWGCEGGRVYATAVNVLTLIGANF